MASIISNSVAETFAIARDFAHALRPNDVVALRGELGAGKTHFVKGLVAGCGSAAEVTSPTFTLLHEYRDGRLAIYHFDFYRLENSAEAEGLGFEDYLSLGGVVVVEWADRFPELFPPRTRWFELKICDEQTREIVEMLR